MTKPLAPFALWVRLLPHLFLVWAFVPCNAVPALAGLDHHGATIQPTGSLVPTSDIPDPSYCSVEPCDGLGGVVLVPDQPVLAPAADVRVTVRNAADAPMSSAFVVVDFANPVLLCPGAVLTATTDANGEARLRLAGGGCIGSPAFVRIRANGVAIRAYSEQKSPDFDGAGGDGTVNIADLVAFSAEFLDEVGAGCHDYDNNGETNLADLLILSPAFVNASHCP